MAPELSGVPDAVRSLVEVLEREGFKTVREEGGGTVNRVVELGRAGCAVRISADRGEWWVEVGGPGLGDWFDPDVWESCLDGVPVMTEPADLDERVDFVLRRLVDVERAIAADPAIRTCLDRARSTRARTRLGLPPREE